MKDRAKAVAKAFLHRSGLLKAYGTRRHRGYVTALMFHRVLPPKVVEAHKGALDYIVDTDFFEALCGFLATHYDVLTPHQLTRPGALPPRPLVLSFDDGWLDNLHHAAPILARHGLRGTFFVATQAIETGAPFVPERLLDALTEQDERGQQALLETLRPVVGHLNWQPTGNGPRDRETLARTLASASAEIQNAVAAALPPVEKRAMMTVADLQQLADAGHEIGVHGHRHLALAEVSPGEAQADMQTAWSRFQGFQLRQPSDAPAFSFPHGARNEALERQAFEIGFQSLFTSDATLTGVNRDGPVFGRIEVKPAGFVRQTGPSQTGPSQAAFDAAAFACSLSFRPRVGAVRL